MMDQLKFITPVPIQIYALRKQQSITYYQYAGLDETN